MTTSSLFGPAFEGWAGYNTFAESVRIERRFVRSRAAEQFLADVRASCSTREQIIPKDRPFWRARLGCIYEDISTVYPDITVGVEEERPYGHDDMKPVPYWHGEGRANPRGIPVLYMATDRDTALAEVRPWIGAVVSAAQLTTERELKVVDCSKHHSVDSLRGVFGDPTKTREDGIWIAIDRAFATPVTKENEAKDYIPTQVLADLFKAEGYDGLIYKSLLSEDGYNVALFDLDDAKVANCSLFKVDAITFKFSETGPTVYFS